MFKTFCDYILINLQLMWDMFQLLQLCEKNVKKAKYLSPSCRCWEHSVYRCLSPEITSPLLSIGLVVVVKGNFFFLLPSICWRAPIIIINKVLTIFMRSACTWRHCKEIYFWKNSQNKEKHLHRYEYRIVWIEKLILRYDLFMVSFYS